MEIIDQLVFRVPQTLKERWIAQCEKQKITQQMAAVKLVEWFLAQDEIVQLMVTEQLTPSPDLVTLVLDRLSRQGFPRIHSAAEGRSPKRGRKPEEP